MHPTPFEHGQAVSPSQEQSMYAVFLPRPIIRYATVTYVQRPWPALERYSHPASRCMRPGLTILQSFSTCHLEAMLRHECHASS